MINLGDSIEVQGVTVGGQEIIDSLGRVHGRYGIGESVPSANDLELVSQDTAVINGSGVYKIIGTTDINAIFTYGINAGQIITLHFLDVLSLKHNTTGSAGTASMKLTGSTNLTTSADMIIQLYYDGTYFRQVPRIS